MASKILEGVTELIRRDGTKASPSDLDAVPVVALYFSAHWCPPCRAFTPVLQEFYEVSSHPDSRGRHTSACYCQHIVQVALRYC